LNSKPQTNSRLILQDSENLRGDFGCLPTCAYIWQQKLNAKRSKSISQQHAWERFDVFQRANSGSGRPWFPHDLKMPYMKMMMCILGRFFILLKSRIKLQTGEEEKYCNSTLSLKAPNCYWKQTNLWTKITNLDLLCLIMDCIAMMHSRFKRKFTQVGC
jgi:hypothetical protein